MGGKLRSETDRRLSGKYVNAYNDNNDVVLITRDEEGPHLRREKAEFSVFFRKDDITSKLGELRREPQVIGFSEEGDWIRTRWRDYWARRNFLDSLEQRWNIPSFEGDISPARRWLVDHSATMGRPTRAFFDLETDSRVPFAKKEEMRILSWCVIGEDGKEFIGVLDRDEDASEKKLIYDLLRALMPYDQALAWYGDGFDFPVLKARARRHGMKPVTFKRWLFLCQMENFKKQNMHGAQSGAEKRSFALDSIGEELLGYGKADFDAGQTYQEWAAGGARRQRMLDYMLQDVRLQVGIEQKTGYVDLLNSICETCGTLPDSWGMQPTSQVDGIMLRLGKRIGMHFPTKTYGRSAREKQFEGAFVLKPTCKGIQRDVHVFDFSGMYPSIIQSFNMSPETKQADAPTDGPIAEGCCRTPTTGVTFSTGTRGMLAQAVWEIGEMRGKVDKEKNKCPPGTPEWTDFDRKSQALKVVRNAFYGVVGSSFSRYHDVSIAEGITKTGKWLIERTLEEAKLRGGTALFSDTDSGAMIGFTGEEMANFVNWCNAELYPKLIAQQGCKENDVKLAFEKSFERLIIPSSKHYIARIAQYKGKLATVDSKPEIKGVEYKRGSSGLLCVRLQGEAIDLLVGGMKIAKVPVPTERIEDYEECIERHRAHVTSDPLTVEEVQLSQGLSKELDAYAAKTPHVRIAMEMEERGEDVTVGTKIRYVCVDGSVSPKEVISASEYNGECDRIHLWNSIVYPGTERLLCAAFPDHDWGKWYLDRPKKVNPNQGDLFTGMPVAVPLPPRRKKNPPQSAQDAPGASNGRVLRVSADQGGQARLSALRALVDQFPGNQEITLELDTGVGIAVLALKADGSPEFWAAAEVI